MLARLTDEQVLRALGDPAPYIKLDATVNAAWEQSIIAYAQMPAPLALSWNPAIRVDRFKCHRRLVALFEGALASAFNAPVTWAQVGDFGGCYAFRANRKNPRALSRHAWGAAIDLDVADNPQGHHTHVASGLVEIMEAYGFAWGGNFHGAAVDGMHFEFADLGRLE